MAIIFESTNFIVQPAEAPLIDRNDGGHITIDPKFIIATRQQLTAQQAIELMRLTMITGEAMTSIMKNHGVDIGRINYQDNGNWAVFKPEGPQLHYHIYGRATNAVIQKYGQTLDFPHKDEFPGLYKNLKPLTNQDVQEIKKEMERLLKERRYADDLWHL